MKLIVKKGTTSKILRIFVQDSSKTDGSGLTGLVHNTASLTAYYVREGAAAATAITLVNAVVGTFTSSGFKEVSAANMPGVYELHPPNACVASGADSVLIFMKGAANMAPLPIEIQLYDTFDVDVIEVSGDSGAADNIEATYDGTGYANDSAPATQEQVGRLATGSAAINTTAESFTKAGAEPETNTYTSTVGLDGVFHIVEDDAGNTDCYYQFDVGGNGIPVSVTWEGYANSQGDDYTLWAYNYGTTTYEQIGAISCVNGTTVREEVFALSNAHVGTGANIGKVRFRFLSTDGTAFATDRLLCAYAVITKSVGYSDGAIWINTNASNTNTEDYVDGTADNPVSTWAAAKTISASMGMDKFHIVNGSTLTMDANCDNFTFAGCDYILALGGQSFDNTHINGAQVSGIATSGTGELHLVGCHVGAVTIGKTHMDSCAIDDTITISAAETYILNECYSTVAFTPCVLDFNGVLGAIEFRYWDGGLQVKNMGATSKLTLHGLGQIVIDSTCNAGGSIGLAGNMRMVDNVAGGFSGTFNDTARVDTIQIADAVWDEILTGATHNIATSAGRRVREIGAYAIHSGTAQAGTSATITLAATANGGDGIYNRNLIVLTDNTGKGQTRTIVDYDDTSKVVAVDRNWRVTPDATTSYQIVPDDTPLTVDHGLAQAGTATTITIRDYASSTDDVYLCNIVGIISGTGRGQARLVKSYDGANRIVTICGDDWVTTPDTTSVYVMMPYGAACVSCIPPAVLADIADEIWDEDLTTHSTSKSAGWFVKKIKSLADVILAMVT